MIKRLSPVCLTIAAAWTQAAEAATAYSEAVSMYLAFAVSKHAMYGNSLVPWYTAEDRTSMLFTQQVVSMTWDFAEVNPFSEIGGSFAKSCVIVSEAMAGLPTVARSAMQSGSSPPLSGAGRSERS